MIKTKRIGDPAEESDGKRVLITRYRPRNLRQGEESWDAWDRRLSPSVELLDAFQGKRRERGRVVERDLAALPWETYVERFQQEMTGAEASAAIREYARLSLAGQTVTFLCFCADEAHCHRSLVRRLVEARQKRQP